MTFKKKKYESIYQYGLPDGLSVPCPLEPESNKVVAYKSKDGKLHSTQESCNAANEAMRLRGLDCNFSSSHSSACFCFTKRTMDLILHSNDKHMDYGRAFITDSPRKHIFEKDAALKLARRILEAYDEKDN